MAWHSLELANYKIDPIARYKSLGTHDLIQVGIRTLDGLAIDIENAGDIPPEERAFHSGWINAEISEIHETRVQDAQAISRLATARKKFWEIKNLTHPKVFDLIDLNRTLSLFDLRNELLVDKNETGRLDVRRTQQYLGHLAAGAYGVSFSLKGEAQQKTRGAATEALFASLILDDGSATGVILPAPASPRLEKPIINAYAFGRQMNTARDFTVIQYDKRGRQIDRKPVQIKTRQRAEDQFDYCPEIALISRDSHLGIVRDKDALDMAIALEKPSYTRSGVMQRLIHEARQNILDELKIKH